ncbi:hypothetical protein FSP39_014909 [Pinctada imbricata]|uniref:Flavin-containing monooxygenase n=1 Tax=Pinctada imbricata TaxID=66713 RepID=A0AA88XWQ3_PINIB|nr:hypothetical protein FSP39_014909 [Pinctada imbricata]
MTGAIRMKPDIHESSDRIVSFADGSSENIDAVVMATGYTYTIPFVDDSVLRIKENETSLYKYVFPPHHTHPTFGVVGLVQAIGAVMPIAEMQCRWFTRLQKGLCKLPSGAAMLEDIERKRAEMKEVYVPTRRHTLQTYWIEIMDDIASEIGVKPDLVRLFRDDPWLAARCYFGPCLPAQYRLQGPGKWNGAKSCIQNALRRCTTPMHGGLKPKNAKIEKSSPTCVEATVPFFLKSYILIFLFFLFLTCVAN